MRTIKICGITVLVLFMAAGIFFVQNFLNPDLTASAIENLENENASIDLVMFYGQGCPHCGGMESFLSELEKKYHINVIKYEIYFNQYNIKLFEEISACCR